MAQAINKVYEKKKKKDLFGNPRKTLLCPGIYKEMEATTKTRKIDCTYLLKKASYCTNWSRDPTHVDKMLGQ